MKRRFHHHKRLAAGLLILAILVIGTGCSTSAAVEQASPYQISIMLPTYVSGPHPDDTSPVVQELERYTNTDIELQWVPFSVYQDKTKITLSSLKLPSIMLVLGKSPEFISAVRKDVFWELGLYLDDYPNLSQANKTVLDYTSVDGKIYAVYRARDLGRYGVTIRKDWLDNLGLSLPRTIDEFFEVLRAFTYDDPDQDGRQDTYGLVVTTYPSTFEIIQSWFGAPNGWGIDEDGHLVPAHLTEEYREALRFLRKLYEEGLINPDFAVRDPNFWRDALVHGEAGVIVDVADQAQRVAHSIEKTYNLTDVIDVFASVEGPAGVRLPSTSGYEGMLAISRSAVKTENELRRVLDFLDKVNDEEMQVLLYNGIKGRHYNKTPEFANADLAYEKVSLNQLLMFIPETRTLPPAETPIRKKVNEVIKANEAILVDNPAESLISETYMKKGPALDTLVSDARTKYILGQIDEEGWEQEIERWLRSGGSDYIAEINKAYQETLISQKSTITDQSKQSH